MYIPLSREGLGENGVGRVGVEPTWCLHRRILSPLRLPIPPSPRGLPIVIRGGISLGSPVGRLMATASLTGQAKQNEHPEREDGQRSSLMEQGDDNVDSRDHDCGTQAHLCEGQGPQHG
jgi:hypothetical protein